MKEGYTHELGRPLQINISFLVCGVWFEALHGVWISVLTMGWRGEYY